MADQQLPELPALRLLHGRERQAQHILAQPEHGQRGLDGNRADLREQRADDGQKRKLRGAGLDVFAEEPAKNHALYSHPHVSCTPHIGAQTAEAQKRVGAEIVDIIKNFA